MRRFMAFIVLVLLCLAAQPALADPATGPQNEPVANGADIPAVFTRWARVAQKSYTYTAPGGQTVRYLDDWDTWLSIRGSTVLNGQTWYRTHANQWVRASDVRFMPLTQFEGYYFQGDEQGQLGFVVEDDTWVLGDAFPRAKFLGSLGRYTPVGIVGAKNGYYQIADGQYIWSKFTRAVPQTPRPAQVGSNEKWVDVNLTQQTVVAYEGDTPVFATLTSTGKGETPTITGLYRIYQKFISHTMAGGKEDNDPYTLDEVPWSMYFTQLYALHGAYWHDQFGAVRSHGCVNLTPADAKFIFTWSGPVVPPGQNYVRATADNPGTWVYVHY